MGANHQSAGENPHQKVVVQNAHINSSAAIAPPLMPEFLGASRFLNGRFLLSGRSQPCRKSETSKKHKRKV